jgi:hypothetical protein
MKKFIVFILFFATLCKGYGVSISGNANICHGSTVTYYVTDPLISIVPSHAWIVLGGYFVDANGNNLGTTLEVSSSISEQVQVFWSDNNTTESYIEVWPAGSYYLSGGYDGMSVYIGAQTPVIEYYKDFTCTNDIHVSAISKNSNAITWSVDGGTYDDLGSGNILLHPYDNGNGSGYAYVTATASNSVCGSIATTTKAIPVSNLPIPVINSIYCNEAITADCPAYFFAEVSTCYNNISWSCSSPNATINNNGVFNTSTLGRYFITATVCNPAGCVSYFSMFIVTARCDPDDPLKSANIATSLTNLQPVINSKDINIFPCPTTGILNINVPNMTEIFDIEVFNINGENVFLQKFGKTMAGIKAIDLSNNPKGLYIVKIITSDNIQEEKIIIE